MCQNIFTRDNGCVCRMKENVFFLLSLFIGKNYSTINLRKTSRSSTALARIQDVLRMKKKECDGSNDSNSGDGNGTHSKETEQLQGERI